MTKKTIFGTLLFCFTAFSICAQQNYDSTIIGIWKGTSLCQIKNSACHDEQVVYHISKDKSPNEYQIIANKIVNGAEEEMGTLYFRFDKLLKELTCSSKQNTIWRLKLTNQRLEGTLYYNNALLRVIKVEKIQ